MTLSRGLLALFFVAAGANHFIFPKLYLSIMPPYLPWLPELVALSGAAEIAGGIGILLPATRRAAGWGLMALLVAIFPANIQALSSGMVSAGRTVPAWILWLRLPFQVVLLIWVYRAALLHPERFHRIQFDRAPRGE